MATVEAKTENKGRKNGYEGILLRFNELMSNYSSVLSSEMMQTAFRQAAYGMANQPQIQNSRIKGISSLPADYTKEDIGAFLRNPYNSEQQLRNTAETLKWTAYPFFKMCKTYQDIPTYRHYIKPLFLTAEGAKTKEFLREATLLEKISKTINPATVAHKIVGQAVNQGKVFYQLRTNVDKVHNKVNYAFMQQLPQDWCTIVGYNNVSGYTVSFNMMYFLTPGTDYRQFGDLFEPYIEDFNAMFERPDKKRNPKYVYASGYKVPNGQRMLRYYPNNLNPLGFGNPRTEEWVQKGTWCYWVTLPIDKVWTYEIDDTTAAVASPLSGLMITYSQQSDYEAAQLSLLLNPLIKIFTGEIPYFDSKNGSAKDDDYRLSIGGRALFETFFNSLMAANNTGGTAFYSAPVENIKSHDFSESANANEVSESFNRYGMEKAGLASIIPVTDDVKASQVDASTKIESRYATATIYKQFERMMNHLYSTLNLNYEWEFVMFGTIFDEAVTRDNALKAIANGDISAHFVLAALDGGSWIEKLSMMRTIKESGILDMLIPPLTSYTAKQDTSGLPPQAGRPQTDDISDSKEKQTDTNGGLE